MLLTRFLSIPREKVPYHSWKAMQGEFQDGTESGFLRDAILLLTLVRLNSILRAYLFSAHR